MSRCNKLPNLQRSQTMTAENEGCCSGQTSKNGFTRKLVMRARETRPPYNEENPYSTLTGKAAQDKRAP